MRKTRISPQKIVNLARQFSNLSLNEDKTDISNKENISNNTPNIERKRLNIDRLMKIQNKKNVIYFLKSLNNN